MRRKPIQQPEGISASSLQPPNPKNPRQTPGPVGFPSGLMEVPSVHLFVTETPDTARNLHPHVHILSEVLRKIGGYRPQTMASGVRHPWIFTSKWTGHVQTGATHRCETRSNTAKAAWFLEVCATLFSLPKLTGFVKHRVFKAISVSVTHLWHYRRRYGREFSVYHIMGRKFTKRSWKL